MPWKVVKRESGWYVVKEGSGKPVHKKPHKTRIEAIRHLKALYANYPSKRGKR